MPALAFAQNALVNLAKSVYGRIVAYTDALNQARAQSARFSGAYW